MEQSRLVSGAGASFVPKPTSSGDGSSLDTILNVVNIAFGAGMLGLPFAIQGAGFVFGVFGLGVVILWNFVCCWLLVEVRAELLKAREMSPVGSELAAMKGKPVSFAGIGSFAMGNMGMVLVHVSVIITLLGASTAYFISTNDLLRLTRFYVQPEGWSDETAMYINTVIYMLCMYPVTCIRSLAPLSKLSGPAIVALVAGFFVVIKLGLDAYGWPSWSDVMEWDALWLPQTFKGFSAFFGVAVFSYGATIIIIEIQESMEDPGEFVGALKLSLWIIWAAYASLGGITVLIYQQAGNVSANIMEDLKGGDAAQEPLRVFIVMATLLTYPLAMQPVSTVLGRALVVAGLGGNPPQNGRKDGYGAVESAVVGETAPDSAVGTILSPQMEDDDASSKLSPAVYFGLRAVLVLFTGICATSVPNFGIVVSLLGSFSVTLGSFVLPPLFHFMIFRNKQDPSASSVDMVLFVVGMFTCIFTTTTTTLGIFSDGE